MERPLRRLLPVKDLQLVFPPRPKRPLPTPSSTPKPLGAVTPDMADAFLNLTDTQDSVRLLDNLEWAYLYR
jgi:hypothetical protein